MTDIHMIQGIAIHNPLEHQRPNEPRQFAIGMYQDNQMNKALIQLGMMQTLRNPAL
jgi:hypothetical protein